MAAVRLVLQASGGRAFFLFTSHRALAEAALACVIIEWQSFPGESTSHARDSRDS